MPDLWTHKIAGNIVKSKLSISFTPYEEKLYNYFLQGPDVFLFTESLNHISWQIHKIKPGAFLWHLFQRCDNLPLLLGFLSHFDIDRFTHGYIIYLSGEDAKLHEEIEFALDNALSLLFYGISPKGKDFIDIIPHTFPQDVEECFNDVYKYVYNEELILNIFTRSLGGFVEFYKDLSFENRFRDILNLKKRLWCDPYAGKECNLDFLKLMEVANKRTIDRFRAYKKGRILTFPNVSYYTNRYYKKDLRILCYN